MWGDPPEPNYEPPENGVEVPVDIHVQWSNSEIQEQVVHKLLDLIYEDLEPKAQKAALGRLDEAVNKAVTNVITKGVQPTNRFGEPTGERTTIKELLEKEAEEWLGMKVDKYGDTSARGYSKTQTRAEYLFKEVIGDSLADTVKKVIKENIGDIEGLVEAEVKRQLKSL